MSRRLLPPPPLIAPTPSKVRPAAVPLIVMVVAAAAGVAGTTTTEAATRQSAERIARREGRTYIDILKHQSTHPHNTFPHMLVTMDWIELPAARVDEAARELLGWRIVAN